MHRPSSSTTYLVERGDDVYASLSYINPPVISQNESLIITEGCHTPYSRERTFRKREKTRRAEEMHVSLPPTRHGHEERGREREKTIAKDEHLV